MDILLYIVIFLVFIFILWQEVRIHRKREELRKNRLESVTGKKWRKGEK